MNAADRPSRRVEPPDGGVQGGAFVPRLRKYEARWARRLSRARELVDSGERDLSRVVRLVEAAWRKTDLSPTEGAAFGTVVTLPQAALVGGRREVIVRAVLDACVPETSMVVELGSGWGNNLADLYLAGGPRVPHYGLEPTAAGRACAELLARLEPDFELRTAAFDFEQPRYDLPCDNGHVLVFTSHGVEQVAELPRVAITGLFALGRSVTCVHLEPIGWQVHADALPGSREYALRRGYNRNLWPLLSELAEAGELRIETVVPDLLGHKRHIASSLVVWRRDASGSSARPGPPASPPEPPAG